MSREDIQTAETILSDAMASYRTGKGLPDKAYVLAAMGVLLFNGLEKATLELGEIDRSIMNAAPRADY